MEKEYKHKMPPDLKREVWLAELWTSSELYRKVALFDLFGNNEFKCTFEIIEQLLAEHIFLGGFNHD